jgi:hypothetical protein
MSLARRAPLRKSICPGEAEPALRIATMRQSARATK